MVKQAPRANTFWNAPEERDTPFLRCPHFFPSTTQPGIEYGCAAHASTPTDAMLLFSPVADMALQRRLWGRRHTVLALAGSTALLGYFRLRVIAPYTLDVPHSVMGIANSFSLLESRHERFWSFANVHRRAMMLLFYPVGLSHEHNTMPPLTRARRSFRNSPAMPFQLSVGPLRVKVSEKTSLITHEPNALRITF